MIQVEAETARALNAPFVDVQPRLRWALQGGVLDLSDRLIAGALPRIRHDIGAYLAGERYPDVYFELINDDGLLTPADVTGSVLANKKPGDYLLDTITYDVGVKRADGTYEYIPAYTGLVTDVLLEPGKVTVTASAPFTYAMQTELPWEFVFRRGNLGFLDAATYLMGANTTISYPTDYDASYINHLELLKSHDWNLYGTIKSGTTIGSAMLLIAKSCLGTIWTTETGTLAFASEFPGVCGDLGYFPSYVPDPLLEADGSDWRMSRPIDLAASQVIVAYQGVSCSWRSTADEGNIGRLPRTVVAPYMATLRQAATSARILYEAYGNYPTILAFTMGPRGMLVQVNDRIPIVDPFTNTLGTYRVTSKDFAGPAMTRLEVVAEGHESTVISSSAFAKWGTTTWDTAGAIFL
jgi:hypothetical protein